jgi:hypothetical protein
MTDISLTPMQAEEVTVKTLMDIHQDMLEELQHYDEENGLELEDYYELIESVISIEVIMKELLREEEYITWKYLYGLDRTY